MFLSLRIVPNNLPVANYWERCKDVFWPFPGSEEGSPLIREGKSIGAGGDGRGGIGEERSKGRDGCLPFFLPLPILELTTCPIFGSALCPLLPKPSCPRVCLLISFPLQIEVFQRNS